MRSDILRQAGFIDGLLPDQFSRAEPALELDLMNIDGVMYPAQMVGNASWIESTGGDFCIYQEGAGPAVGRVMDAVDTERLAVAQRLNVPVIPFARFASTLCGALRSHRVRRQSRPGT
ncbi:MAG TPA: NAD/NADP octopine/nopaline dehydrogenase family protein [Pseudonocardia sp.]|nr:NAD/NADP octopine/nopaline dehydrogenase family protein [Pseudonocardia sp.]